MLVEAGPAQADWLRDQQARGGAPQQASQVNTIEANLTAAWPKVHCGGE